MPKSYMGIDVHKKNCVFSEIDADGNLLHRGQFCNRLDEVSDFASSLSSSVHLVLEPVLNYLWLLDQFESFCGSVHVATPYKVRIIAESKCKTDRYDSLMLAELLRVNFLPESYLAPKDIRFLRELLRQRFHLVKSRTRLKNRIRHLLFLNGTVLQVADISSPKAHKEIKRLYLSSHVRESIMQCLTLIKQLNYVIKPLEAKILESSRDIEDVQLLMTIPGVGYLLAAIIYAEVSDITRFKSRKAFANYTGLIPSMRSSGEKEVYGGITRLGSRPLRTALVEVAIKVVRYSESLNRLYMRIQYRQNVQKARVAVARKLSSVIYAMLRNREGFRR